MLGSFGISLSSDVKILAGSLTNSPDYSPQKRWREKRKRLGLCPACASTEPLKNGIGYCTPCRAIKRRYSHKRYHEIKMKTFEMYGGAICHCCGEQELLFLTLDHINEDGAKHRKEMLPNPTTSRYNTSGLKTYMWLKRHNYPPGFQVLCRNCNWGKHQNGGTCPHKKRQ